MPVVARAENLANSVSERIHLQFGISQNLAHRYFGIFIMPYFFRCQSFKFLKCPVTDRIRSYSNLNLQLRGGILGLHTPLDPILEPAIIVAT